MSKKTEAASSSVDITTFAFNKEAALSARCAEFLVWLCAKSPKIFVSPNVAVRAIMGYGHTPRITSDEVKKLRSRYGTIRKILRSKYKMDLLVEAGGIRATVDSADALQTSVPKAVKKLDSARTAVVAADALVDMKTVPNTPELAPYRAMHNQRVKPLVKLLMSSSFEEMLKLPVSTADNTKP
jgi:hypothetical protein